MTEEEFSKLKTGIVVSDRFDKDRYYVIDEEDVFGNVDCAPECIVFGATEMDGTQQIRIDKSNAQFWHIEGKLN